MKTTIRTLILLTLLPLAAPAADTMAPVETGYLDPLLDQKSPWTLAAKPSAPRMRETLRRLSEAAGQLEADFRDSIDAADATLAGLSKGPRQESAAGQGQLRDALSDRRDDQEAGRLAPLTEGYTAADRRMAQLDRALEALADVDRSAFAAQDLRRAVRDLERRIQRARSASDTLRVRVEDLLTQSDGRPQALRLQDQAWASDARCGRLAEAVARLRRKTR